MGLYADYVDYFRTLCAAHPTISHVDDVGSDAFAVLDIEEALGDFRTRVSTKGMIFRLINYTMRVGDRGEEMQVYQDLQGAFMIADYYSSRKDGNFETALANAEAVTLDFVERMILDSRNGYPLWNYSLDSAQQFNIQPMGGVGDGSYAGWLVLFDFQHPLTVCGDNRANWTDGATTSY